MIVQDYIYILKQAMNDVLVFNLLSQEIIQSYYFYLLVFFFNILHKISLQIPASSNKIDK